MIRSHLARPFSFDRRANTALINIAQSCGINRCLLSGFLLSTTWLCNILTISIWLDQPAGSSGSESQNKSFLACANKFVGKQKHENWCWQGWEEGHTHLFTININNSAQKLSPWDASLLHVWKVTLSESTCPTVPEYSAQKLSPWDASTVVHVKNGFVPEAFCKTFTQRAIMKTFTKENFKKWEIQGRWSRANRVVEMSS